MKLKILKTSSFGNYIIASNSEKGALSIFTDEDFIVSNLLQFENADVTLNTLKEKYNLLGYTKKNAEKKSLLFLDMMQNDGWLEEDSFEKNESPMQSVYIHITEQCNFNCPYCYQGNNHNKKHMRIHTFEKTINFIKSVNKESSLAISGGEPLKHPKIDQILYLLEKTEMRYRILTNGSLIDNEAIKLFKKCDFLDFVQVSLDGSIEKIHNFTRKNTFSAVMAGINQLIEHKIPFIIAPTVHDCNVHDIYNIAKFTFLNNGEISPNNLRSIYGNAMSHLNLSDNNLVKSIKMVKKAAAKFKDKTSDITSQSSEDITPKKTVCGLGFSLFCIDVNGDFFPCHLLTQKQFKLGSINNTFQEILENPILNNIRVSSQKIKKCKSCHFVMTCHGGCRADAYHNHNTFCHRDSLCDVLYKFEVENLILQRTGKHIEYPLSASSN